MEMIYRMCKILPLLAVAVCLVGCETDPITGLGTSSISVKVQDAGGTPLAGVEIAVFNLEAVTAHSDAAGTASFTGLADIKTIVRAKMEGRGRIYREVQLKPGDNRITIILLPIEEFEDGFEDGVIGDDYSLLGDGQWYVTGTDAHTGTYSVHSGTIDSYEECSLVLEFDADSDMVLRFWYRIETNPYDHYFNFSINGQSQISESGTRSWSSVEYPLIQGLNILMWEYDKRRSGSDYGGIWVDDISILSQ